MGRARVVGLDPIELGVFAGLDQATDLEFQSSKQFSLFDNDLVEGVRLPFDVGQVSFEAINTFEAFVGISWSFQE